MGKGRGKQRAEKRGRQQQAAQQELVSHAAGAPTSATPELSLGAAPSPAAHAVQLRRLGPGDVRQSVGRLQRAYGNRYVGQVAAQAAPLVVQPKLTVTAPGDQYEEEAERVAGQVMRQIQGGAAQRDPGDDEEQAPLMRKGVEATGGMAVSPGVESAIEGARGGGQPLPEGTRAAMEGAIGADFAGVRVHTGGQAHTLNEELSARAFTTGQDIFFRQGEYASGSAEGQRLLAHELSHVVQQTGGAALSPPSSGTLQRMLSTSRENKRFLERGSGGRDELKKSRTDSILDDKRKSETEEVEEEGEPGSEMEEEVEGRGELGSETEEEVEPDVTSMEEAKEGDGKLEETDEPASVAAVGEVDDVEVAEGHYWARAVVRSSSDGNNEEISKLKVLNVSISPERRTTLGGKLQGDHLVAWSAMVRYWNQALQGDLPTVLTRLKQFILDDQVGDQDTGGKNRERRAVALRLVNELSNGNIPINKVLAYLETAISLFVEANQYSSFAVQGKASGSKGEAEHRKKLEEWNSNPESTNGTQVVASARALIDVEGSGKHLNDITLAKAVAQWHSMLEGNYPNLTKTYGDDLLKTTFSSKKVSDLKSNWENAVKDGKSTALAALKPSTSSALPPVDTEVRETTGVLVNVKPSDEDANALSAAQVKIDNLELPERLRAKTKFFTTQGSHTLAWTFERKSLMKQFTNKTAEEVLRALTKLVTGDKDSLSEQDGDLAKEADELLRDINNALSKTMSLDEWILQVNQFFVTFIEINQRLPTTSYKGAGNPVSHGEAAANKAFEESSLSLDKLVDYAHKFIDVGLLYRPLLEDVQAYSTSLGGPKLRNERKEQLDAGDPFLTKFGSIESEEDAKKLVIPSDESDSEESGASDATKKEEKAEGEAVASKPSKEEEEKVKREEDAIAKNFHTWLTVSTYHSKKAGETLKVLSAENYHKLRKLAHASKSMLKYRMNEYIDTIDISDQFTGSPPGVSEINKRLNLDPRQKNEFKSLQKRVDNIITSLANYRFKNGEVAKADQNRVLEKSILLSQPWAYMDNLYKKKELALQKVFGDFYMHMEHYSPAFFEYMSKTKDARETIVREALLAPLAVRDITIGDPLKQSLGDTYIGFIFVLKAHIMKRASRWTDRLLKKPS